MKTVIQSNVKESTISAEKLVYELDDVPPMGHSIIIALQHIFAAFGGIVVVPMLVAEAAGVDVSGMAYLISAALFASGLATFIQVKGIGSCGSRFPVMMGNDTTFISPGITVAQTLGLPAYFGATILGSFIEIILSKCIRPIMKYFPKVVTGTVMVLMGTTLIPVAIDWAAGGAGAPDYGSLQNVCIAGIVLVIALFLNNYGKGIFSIASPLIAIFCGYVICGFLGMLNFTPVANAKWVELPQIFKFGVDFNLMGLLPFIPAYLVTTIETMGHIVAIGETSGRPANSKRISGGLFADGVGSLLAGFLGSGPNTSFAQNAGLIPLTRVASTYVMIVAGIILMLLGVFPKFGALVAIMPQPVLGGVGLMMFGMVASTGIKSLAEADLSRRNLLILAVALGLGVGVTVRPDIISELPFALKMLFGSGISTGTIAAVVLNILLKEDE